MNINNLFWILPRTHTRAMIPTVTIWLYDLIIVKRSQHILLIWGYLVFFFTKNSAEFRLHLGHPKLLTTINLLNQPIITRSHNSRPYIKHHNSTPHTIHTIYISYKFNMNMVHISYHKILKKRNTNMQRKHLQHNKCS
jgi:hypothetical protein